MHLTTLPIRSRIPAGPKQSSSDEPGRTPGPVALIILDGFGLAEPGPGNAVELARTPNFDRYLRSYPSTRLEASGEAVGLPKGQMGNSEVGHLNLGAGRVVKQSLTYISDKIRSGEFSDNEVLCDLMDGVQPGKALHLVGLMSDGGVHSTTEHVSALLQMAREKGVGQVYIHAFTDGRDTSPDSGLGFIEQLESEINRAGYQAAIATVGGRYFGMDRDRRWDRVERAYRALVQGQAPQQAEKASEAVGQAYSRGETDEFIKPTVITSAGQAVGKIEDGDAVFVFNFRADRVRQISQALLGDHDWEGFKREFKPQLSGFASMMEIDKSLEAPFAFALPELVDTLPQVLEQQGLQQFHAAETEKYPHVTYFFNALEEQPVAGETREVVPSPKVATYDLQPEMSASQLTATTLERLQSHHDAFLLINYANPDMVGHSGDLEATIQACEVTDKEVGEVVEGRVRKELGGRLGGRPW